jgi:outer membrane biogenesis lipoprotein LolB
MHRRLVFLVAMTLLCAATLSAQRPPENVSPKRHPNIAAAQRFVEQAWNRITAAQEANEFDLGGHAARAKELLDQVNKELKLAAEAANHR